MEKNSTGVECIYGVPFGKIGATIADYIDKNPNRNVIDHAIIQNPDGSDDYLVSIVWALADRSGVA